MQAPFDNIVQHLFHQPSLLSVTVNELERMAEQHPYFAAAHFLLLKKMQDTQHPQFNSQLHKTTLYFNNPLWLQFLLQPEKVQHLPVLDRAPFLSDEQASIEKSQHSEPEDDATIAPVAHQHADTNQIIHHEHLNAETVAPQVHTGMMDVITEVFHEPQETFNAHKAIEEAMVQPQEAFNEPAAQTLDASTTKEEITEQSSSQITTEDLPVTVEPVPPPFSIEPTNDSTESALLNDEQFNHVGLVEGSIDNTTENNSLEQKEETFAEIDNSVTAIPKNETFRESQTEHFPSDLAESFDAAETTAPGDALPETTPALPEAVAENTANDVTEPATEIEQADETAFVASGQPTNQQAEKPLLKIIETPAAQDDMLFEPYHTVDYFASQGIKLSKAETEAKDKLGRKLRSFTDWLKTMKKLPQASIENILSKNEESKVVEDAIHSIENKEVITEAMAEVFEKQGLSDKAVEVYHKLSLLNPAKSAYFAAKIEDLKH